MCPCRDCIDRKVGCHSACENYNSWKTERKEVTDAINKEKVITGAIIDHRKKFKERMRRSHKW